MPLILPLRHTNLLYASLFSLILLFAFYIQSEAKATTYKVAAGTVTTSVKTCFQRLKDIYNRAGHDIELVLEANARSIESVNKGKYDGELARIAGVNEFYTNLVPLTEPIMYQELVIAYRKGETYIPKTLDDLVNALKNGVPVGFTRGNKFLTNSIGIYDAQPVSSGKSLMKMVHTNRIRYAASFLGVLEPHQDEFPEVEVGLDQTLLKIPMFHYVHFKNVHLVKVLSDATRDINKDGGGVPTLRHLNSQFKEE
ncbi:transporter substrate-binding domain-containing protein [Terasakiella sp. A23]|uniref:transporter substrate-binding domain-containing protein n=1 Tax=Terasakiella sp. FCG-A23 TaxID=3080561 RepID=UPI0029544D70|nr:transporter substrate-binding domain-containing protein [Terasakiella sp. A23]MDV7340419.1 transporter substrate-binding domain-containing protein [Terasakiella sp. A23]